jgi:hypothetical protein
LFTAFVSGNAGDSETNVVTASGVDDNNNPILATDSAIVTINDVASSITVTKTANPTQVNELGGNVTFTFVVNNPSPVGSVMINNLTGSIYGVLNGKGNCSVPGMIAAGGSYSCSFTAFVGGNPGTHMNVVMASGVDDDGNDVSATDDAVVTINNVPPSALVTKSVTLL